jgi:hypothetical protein
MFYLKLKSWFIDIILLLIIMVPSFILIIGLLGFNG